MTTPRVEIDLVKIRDNTRSLVTRLGSRNISVTGVTKAVRANPLIAQAMLDGGAVGLADSRITNLMRLHKSGIHCPKSLIRTPMLSQVEQVLQVCDTSFNSELDVIAQRAKAARHSKTNHNVILVVEMGDMREGIMPENLAGIAKQVMKMRGVDLKGIAANFACLKTKSPDASTMKHLSELANEIETTCGPFVETVSGGNSANLLWAFSPCSTGRINNLRLGEAILLGTDPVTKDQIDGLHSDAFTLVAEVIETVAKPNPIATFTNPQLKAWPLLPAPPNLPRSILGIGEQDTDIAGLTLPPDFTCLGATSDHMVVQSTRSRFPIGTEVRLKMNYSALMRIMTAPDTTMQFVEDTDHTKAGPTKRDGPLLQLV